MEKQKKFSPYPVLWQWAKPYRGGYIGSVILSVLSVACSMVPYFCIATVINLLLSKDATLTNCLMWCGIALAAYLGKVLFSAFSTMISHRSTFNTLRDIRKNLLSKLSRVPMGTILSTSSGQYKTTIVDRVDGMESTLAHLLPEMTANILVPLAILVYLFVLDWRMALASMVTLVVGIVLSMGSAVSYSKRWQGAVEAGRNMSNAIVEYVGGIQVVKAFSQSAGSYKKYADAVNYNAKYYVKWMRDVQIFMSSWTAIIPAVLVTVLPVGFTLWVNGSLEIGTFLTIIVLSLGFTGPILAAFSFIDDLAVVGTNTKEIADILDAPELVRPEKPADLKSNVIKLNNVAFSYDDKGGEVLHNINLTINPNTVTALVGPSGSGKSTIAKLIAGFWDVTDGEITFGDVNVKNIPLEQQNSLIAYVSQDNYLFDRSIRENIRMGRLDASDEEVEKVAKATGCDEFIKNLENGYDTVAGGGGGHLSGGEKQRISIARAMLKNAPIIILDEATASIDPENEAMIQKALSELTKEKTLIVIAHRLSTIADADNIVVVNKGDIVAQGKQEELLNSCTLYSDMWYEHLGVREQNI